MHRTRILVATATLGLALVACGKKDKKDNGCGANCGGPGGGFNSGEAVQKPTIDLQGAAGLLILNPDETGSAALFLEHNRRIKEIGIPEMELTDGDAPAFGLTAGAAGNGKGEDSLKTMDENGNVKAAVTNSVEKPAPSSPPGSPAGGSGTPPPQTTETVKLPKILTIAVSPKKEIFLHFERPFRHKKPEGQQSQNGPGENPWSDGTYCQLFKVKGGTVDELKTKGAEADNLECLTYDYMVDGWQASRLSVFQFDSAGNAYFPGALPSFGSQKMVVYKRDSTGKLSEMINANICVQDFLVTPSGGVFYTGTSSCQGGGGSGGFFRYVSGTNGSLTEIARDWWNFIYEAVSTAGSDKAVFFGPDPTSASTASWSSACLFQFDPNGGSTTAARTSAVITCGADIWSWVNMSRQEDRDTYGRGFQNDNDPTAAWKTEFASRCTSSGQVFAGGGSQINAIRQDSAANIYIIGNVRKKNAGILNCGVVLRGPHCNTTEGPDLDYATSSACTTAQGTWVDKGWCNGATATTSSTCFTGSGTWQREDVWYNEVTTTICATSGALASTAWRSSDNAESFLNATTSAEHVAKFRVNNYNCSPPASNGTGDQWTSEYKGLAKVNKTTKTLSLLSRPTEQAIAVWVIQDEDDTDQIYYAAYDTTAGRYTLERYAAAGNQNMVSNFEFYHLSASPVAGKLLYDGLDFSNNSYTFGEMSQDSPFTRTQKTDFTGTLKTVVILPK